MDRIFPINCYVKRNLKNPQVNLLILLFTKLGLKQTNRMSFSSLFHRLRRTRLCKTHTNIGFWEPWFKNTGFISTIKTPWWLQPTLSSSLGILDDCFLAGTTVFGEWWDRHPNKFLWQTELFRNTTNGAVWSSGNFQMNQRQKKYSWNGQGCFYVKQILTRTHSHRNANTHKYTTSPHTKLLKDSDCARWMCGQHDRLTDRETILWVDISEWGQRSDRVAAQSTALYHSFILMLVPDQPLLFLITFTSHHHITGVKYALIRWSALKLAGIPKPIFCPSG